MTSLLLLFFNLELSTWNYTGLRHILFFQFRPKLV